jgi:hypothetical protein
MNVATEELSFLYGQMPSDEEIIENSRVRDNQLAEPSLVAKTQESAYKCRHNN